MSATALALPVVIAYHDTDGGTAGPMMLVVFLGAVATGAWLLFSSMEWRNTIMVAVAGWLVLLALTFVL